MPKEYLLNYNVTEWKEARALSSESNWRILEYLREVGPKGATAREVSKELSMPIQTVFAQLAELEREEFLYRERVGKGERAKKYFIRNIIGFAAFDEDFVDDLEEKASSRLKDMIPVLLNYIEEMYEMFEKDQELKEWVPVKSSDSHCPNCEQSHEAENFFRAILYYACDFLTSRKEYADLLLRNGYMSRKAYDDFIEDLEEESR